MVLESASSLLIQTMCQGPPSSNSTSSSSNPSAATMNNHLTVETDDSFSSLIDLAANDDLDGFRRSADRDPSAVDEVGQWYGRKKGCNRMVLQHRTPLMVAATYGSIRVLSYILSELMVEVNRSCGDDKTTALHCAASGGSENAVEAVKILLSAGADPNSFDVDGLRPADVIVVPPRLLEVKAALEELLGGSSANDHALPDLTSKVSTNSPPSSLSPEDGGSPSSNSTSSPMTIKFPELQTLTSVPEKKEYPIDPSLPDIKNSIYSTDEFRMFSFKVRPCSRAYSHDWTECPFVHPGENARRRDPRKYHYSCVPCPDFRKGACRRGDMCEYAHGVFECWLHPAQYRTRLCKDGMSCNRRVCFFAHTNEELRPLYMSTGSAVPSPRSTASAAMEMAMAMGLVPGSPSSASATAGMSPFSSPMSPSNGLSHSVLNWPQPNVPTLHLPGSNLQSSRLRSSLSARDMPVDDYSMMQDFEAQQLINDFCLSRLGTPSAGNRSARSKILTPSNLEDLFTAESFSSPRYNSEQGAMFSPSHKTAFLNQFQQQQQSLLSPINTGVFSPKVVDPQQLSGHNTLLQASLAISSPGRMSPRGVEPISPMSSRLAAIAQREQQQQSLRSLSSRDLGSGRSAIADSSLSSSWSKWGSPSGAADWGVNGEELGSLRRSSSFELRSTGEEPDLSWVHCLVKESPPEKLVTATTSALAVGGPSPLGTAAVATPAGGEGRSSTTPKDGNDQAAALGAWLEQMQLDQMVA
ncbi:zinc finger CCCH domain-containing protein 24-like [Iris pallida]|uniref:Zinc finger CCCH domain-containing protein 24-like n=1 Tax=Iris pallida TaxID=29817 RepID=A0AAX6FIU0_IRIPA|nr:zinc finger CCCH domain-containing protein 24-like [Iris pallida]